MDRDYLTLRVLADVLDRVGLRIVHNDGSPLSRNEERARYLGIERGDDGLVRIAVSRQGADGIESREYYRGDAT